MPQRAAVLGFLVILLILFAAGACEKLGGPLEPGKIGQPCQTMDDCGYGEKCVAGVCAPSFCDRNDDCGSDQLKCCAGECIPKDESCDTLCLSDSDCPGGICLGGRCVYGCASNEDCPEGQWCVPYLNVCLPRVPQPDGDAELPEGGEFDFELDFDLPDFDLPDFFELPDLDLQACSTDEDCERGRCIQGVCVDLGGEDGKGCNSNSDCASGQYCLFGMCVGQPSDGPCQTNEDCNGGFCLPLLGVCVGGNPGNDRCTTDDDCPPGERCILGVCVAPNPDGDQDSPDSADTPGRCRTDDDCQAGERCVYGFCLPVGSPDGDQDLASEAEQSDSSGGGCTTNDDCPQGQRCILGICM